MNELARVEQPNADVRAYRASTEAAEICKEIVVATSSTIQGRRFVSVEGWQAIAVAHGCALSARDVERVDGGVRAIGEVRRMSDGQLIATGEGFVGEDEATWFGGQSRGKTLPKRNDYAIRAMAQTRAMSRAGRTAFAHVVVMMKAGLATTPAEEVPAEGFDRETGEIFEATPTNEPAARTKLDGPHTSKTALKAAVTKIVRVVQSAESAEAIDKIKHDERQTINQALRDWPELINGDPNVEEDIGLKGAIEARKAALAANAPSVTFQMLSSLLEEAATPADLQNIINQHGDAIDTLDDIERALFENRFEIRETEVQQPAPDNRPLVDRMKEASGIGNRQDATA